MRKKVVFLPYDFDSAIGINNEGALVFGYSLEDTDQTQSGADVYNGQRSVLWNNLRKTFPKELKAMYQELRSTGVLSYDRIEEAFEAHQSKWGEAIFNEDMQFKCLDPLIKDGDGTYLEMMQGSKAEQRKWWLYNRFRYLDSKYNAGDSQSDYIQLRGYAKADITVTPYADIYPTIKYGSYLVQTRGVRNQQYTLVCPVDTMNDTEIYIYSASQLASVGDLSGLKVGLADFFRATKIQSIKLGDSNVSYDNGNLKTLYLGNNILLRTLDVRNCSGLGNYDMKAPDISGCTNIEYVYFDGTNITGLTLPNGGILKVLHLPATITNLTIRNQKAITDFTLPSYASITSLWLDNVSSTVDSKAILNAIPAASRVRLIKVAWEAEDADEIIALYDKLDSMRGLDEYGNNMDTAQISGTIHITTLSGQESAAIGARAVNYPYLTVTADHTSATLTLKTWDGASTVDTVTYIDGVAQTALPSVPSRAQTAQYTYTAVGWATTTDAQTATSGCTTNVTVDKTVYAAYSRTVRTYTVTWKNSNGTVLETDTNVPYGTTPTYTGSTPQNPTSGGGAFQGWTPGISPVTGNVTFTASYIPTYTATFVRAAEDGGGTLYTATFQDGQTVTYGGETPTSTREGYIFDGWTPALGVITANTTYTAKYKSPVVDEEITDDWDTILSNVAAGVYGSTYKIGNYKPLNLGTEGTVNMQIVAMDTDVDADGNTVPLTMVAKELLTTDQQMNASQTVDGGYPASKMRTTLNSTIMALIPANVSGKIKSVIKTSVNRSGNGLTSTEMLWIPSHREIFGDTFYERSGPVYNAIYKDANSRIKMKVGASSASLWWLRSVYPVNGYAEFAAVWGTGNGEFTTPSLSLGVALAFCIGPDTIFDSWEQISAAISDGTYRTRYHVGDTKAIDLGDLGIICMQIAAFDADEDENGNKIPISWVAQQLLVSSQKMNNSDTNAGGYPASAMKTYIDGLKSRLPAIVQSMIVPAVKTSRDRNSGSPRDITSTLELWIPSYREVFGGTFYEQSGPVYSSLFVDANSRKKQRYGASSAVTWWLRSAHLSDASSFARVYDYGNGSGSGASGSYGVALGFCTGAAQS